jgi:putative ABC transport system substrate-binding protein
MEGSIKKGKEILTKLKEPDLILAVGSEALKLMKDETKVPVVFTMVLNPETILGKNHKNITGSSMNIPISVQLRKIKEILKGVKTVGSIYNPNTSSELIKRAKESAVNTNLKLLCEPANTPRDVLNATNRLKGKVDAILMIPDQTNISNQSFSTLLLFSSKETIPIIGISDKFASKGALFAFSCDYKDIGAQAGEIATSILKGKDPQNCKITEARKVNLILNLKIAKRIGIEISEGVKSRATKIYD